MGKVLPAIDDALQSFVARQHVFFVATAPERGGHVNLSPKGLDSLRILDPKTIAYIDYTGSGAETIAHLRENGRIVVMLCAFEGPPRIVRFHGRGAVVLPEEEGFESLASHFGEQPIGVRSVIRIDVERISQSCGYAVPVMKFERERTQLPAWAEAKGKEGLERYKRDKNALSIDGLPALDHEAG